MKLIAKLLNDFMDYLIRKQCESHREKLNEQMGKMYKDLK